MKRKTQIIITLILLAATTSGCLSSTDTYIQEGTDNRLELRGDNQFVIHQANGFSGMWAIDGNHLKLHPLAGGEHILLQNNHDYIDHDGDRWVKS